MTAPRRALLGFEHADGRVGFCCTSAPLLYLHRLADGTYRSRFLSADATLRWALVADSHDEGIRLRDLLNTSTPDAAIELAERHSAPASTVALLRALALAHAGALAAGRTDAGHDQAWRILDDTTEAVFVADQADNDEPADGDEHEPIDCPFAALPEVGSGRHDIDVWADLSQQSFRLAIFDLDGTLFDSSALDDARMAYDWRAVRERLDEVRPFPAWGLRAPHELVSELRDHGKQVAVVTRAPEWYATELLTRFEIEPDHVIAACGANKTGGFRQALTLAGCEGPVDTVVFGDDYADFRAAHAIRAWAMGNPWVNPAMTHFAMPDIAWWDAETLLGADIWRPVLGYVGEAVDGYPSVWHRGSLVPVGPDAWALGRYFPSHHPRHLESLSRAVLDQKDRTDRVDRIAAAFDEAIARLHGRIPIDVVISVPAHNGRVDRFGSYRAAASDHTGAPQVDVRVTREVPKHYKTVTKAARRALREDRFAIPDNLDGLTALLVDDVINTGSTIGALADAAHIAGAARVLQLAFAANQSP